jgi:CRISPR-associated protein Cas2
MAHATQRWRLISFDIRDVRRYRKAIKVLKGYARRIQYSVFRARLDDRETERLRWELSCAMDESDALLLVDLCPRCASRIVSKNQVDDWTAERPTVIFSGEHAPVARPPKAGGTSQ